jgi:GTPase
MIETTPPIEKAVIVGLIYKGQEERQAKEYLEELEFLADTAGASV